MTNFIVALSGEDYNIAKFLEWTRTREYKASTGACSKCGNVTAGLIARPIQLYDIATANLTSKVALEDMVKTWGCNHFGHMERLISLLGSFMNNTEGFQPISNMANLKDTGIADMKVRFMPLFFKHDDIAHGMTCGACGRPMYSE